MHKGPVFTNLLLADEINRASPKVQSALLEAMQERKATIGDTTHELPAPVSGDRDAEPRWNKREPLNFPRHNWTGLC